MQEEVLSSHDDELHEMNHFTSARRDAMEFYLEMMPRIIYRKFVRAFNESPGSSASEGKAMGTHCEGLCGKEFKEGAALRRIHPCGHLFDEKCIKIWLFRGENQHCPACRGNIMKAPLTPKRSKNKL